MLLDIAAVRLIVMEREELFPALSVAARVNRFAPASRFTFCDQLADDRRGMELRVALVILLISNILPVKRALDPVTSTPFECDPIVMRGGIVSRIMVAKAVVTTLALSVKVTCTVLFSSVGLSSMGMATLPDDTRDPVIVDIIPFPESTYDTGFPADIWRFVMPVLVYAPERNTILPAAGTTDFQMLPPALDEKFTAVS